MNGELDRLVEKMKSAFGADLRSVVLYGSAAGGDFHPQHSDLNVLCVLHRLGVKQLESGNEVTRWWVGKGHPAPLLLTEEEIRSAADVFPIEFHDIKMQHKLLHGDDLFTTMTVPMTRHRIQLEHELRSKLLRLREQYMASRHDQHALQRLLTASVSTFGALFRHVLVVLGRPAPAKKQEVFETLGTTLGLDVSPFLALLDIRQSGGKLSMAEGKELFEKYLAQVERVIEEVDRLGPEQQK
jgi:predicted nucleotidyltransferase